MAEVIVYYPERNGERDPAYIEGGIVGTLVRCKDCKRWSEENGSYYGRCDHIKRLTPFDWFCADGERKEEV